MGQVVICDIENIELDGDYSEDGIPSVRLTCQQCGHEEESYGQRGRSVRRCLVLMRENCPQDCKGNYYTTACGVDDDD